MSGKPVGRVWAWFLLASKTKLGLSNQSTFHWKNISDERWERPLLLCGYIKKRLHNASWHMWGGCEDAKIWNQIQEFEIIFIGLLLVHNPQKTDLNECNWMSQCLNVKPKRVWACRLHSKKQLSWNILIGKDSKGDFSHMSGKPVGRVWAWFVLASQTQLRLSNQSTFHWKTISNKRWERHLLLCGYIKKRLHNASWHMDLK